MDGTQVLALAYGARLLGLFAPHTDQNFLWTHPALADPQSARQFYAGSQWHNSGGDRTWLAPELEFFFPNFPNLSVYVQPRELDAGTYQVTYSSGELTLAHDFPLQLFRSKRYIELELTKTIGPAVNPLRLETQNELSRLQYAGYTLRTTLRIKRGAEGSPPQVGIWNLVQLAHRGEFLIPTYSRAIPTVFMGRIDENDLNITDHLLRYRTRSPGKHKLGVSAVAATGRIGYCYSDGHEYTLIIRNIAINPSASYVDVPVQSPDDFGCVIQACSIDTDLGSFAELEYHTPATREASDDLWSQDESQLWAFRGPKEAIFLAGHHLLSSDV